MISKHATVQILTVAAVCFVAGCGSTTKSSFYQLHGSAGGQAVSAPVNRGDSVTVAFRPVVLASYLDRSSVVTLGEGNRVNVHEYDRWVEPLAANITRVLERLTVRMSSGRMETLDWPAPGADAQVAVHITRLDGYLGGRMVLEARWETRRSDGGKETVRTAGGRYLGPAGVTIAEFAAGTDQLLFELARDILASLE